MAFHVEPRPMKTLALILAALVTVTALAETPSQIAADYRAKATTALERLNKTLDTEAAKISATLLALGDAAAVEALAEQVKAKQAGEAVATPVPQAVQLFTAYDAARVKALAPVSDSTLRRIEATLASSEGKKTEVVAELAKLKVNVMAGRISDLDSAPPPNWTFHRTRKGPVEGSVIFSANGDVTFISKIGNKTFGKWSRAKQPDTLTATFPNDEWRISFRKSATEVHSITQATYYLEPVEAP